MQATMKRFLVIAATVVAAGCTQSDYSMTRPVRSGMNPKSNPAILNAEEEKPPKILPETHYAAGVLFERQGQVEKAILQYRKAVALNHSYAGAYNRLGMTLSAVGRHEDAVDALRRAVELRPENPALRNNLGFEFILTEQWDEAENQLEQAVALQPGFARAQVNRGLVLARTGRFSEALSSFKNALSEPDAYYNLGLMLRGQQRYEEAAAAFRQVLAMNPAFSAADVQLDQLSERLEKPRVESPTPDADIVVEAPADRPAPTPTHAETVDVLAMLQDLLPSAPMSVREPVTEDPALQDEVAPPNKPTFTQETAALTEGFVETEPQPSTEEVEPCDASDVEAMSEVAVLMPAVTIETPEPCEPQEDEFAFTLESNGAENPQADEPTAIEDTTEVDADDVVATTKVIPVEPLTEPTAFRDSWNMLIELEDKIVLLRRELREVQTLGPVDQPAAAVVADPMAMTPSFEWGPLTVAVGFEEAVEGDKTSFAWFEETEDDGVEEAEEPKVQNTAPSDSSDLGAVPGDQMSGWSQSFGELTAMLSIVINESRCWENVDAEFAVLNTQPVEFDGEFVLPEAIESLTQGVPEGVTPEVEAYDDARLALPITGGSIPRRTDERIPSSFP